MVDDLGKDWAQTPAEQMNELARLRAENERARHDVLDASRLLANAGISVSHVIDAMYKAQSEVYPHAAALENRAVRPLAVALRKRLAALLADDEAGHEATHHSGSSLVQQLQ